MSNYDRRTDCGEISIPHRRIRCVQYYDAIDRALSVERRGDISNTIPCTYNVYVSVVRGRFNYAIIGATRISGRPKSREQRGVTYAPPHLVGCSAFNKYVV